MPTQHRPDPATGLPAGVSELQHRTRNMLALMRSVMRRSLATVPRQGRTVALLVSRLEAISRVHAVIIRDPLGGVSLRELIDDEVQTQSFGPDLDVSIEGPAVEISAAAAQIIGLAIHELVANSVQHGAIGRGAGWLAIGWEIGRSDQLIFRWQEESSSVLRKKGRGFGTDLITNALPYELKAHPTFVIGRGKVDLTVEFPPAVLVDHGPRMQSIRLS